jgi:hypothetical protein
MGNKIFKLTNLIKNNNRFLSEKELEYFNNIVFKEEYTNHTFQNVKKWKEYIFIYVHKDEIPNHLNHFIFKIINVIIKEINKMSESNQIHIINEDIYIKFKQEIPLLELFFTDKHNMFSKQLSMHGREIFRNKKAGFFNININKHNQIVKGIIYVDIKTYQNDKESVQHILREEIIQSLGMVNDIHLAGSIFNQNWDYNYKYSSLDKKLITFFLSNKIKPGTTKKEVELLNIKSN